MCSQPGAIHPHVPSPLGSPTTRGILSDIYRFVSVKGQTCCLSCPGALRECPRNRDWGTELQQQQKKSIYFKTVLTDYLIIPTTELLRGQHCNLKKTPSPPKSYFLHILTYSFVCFFSFSTQIECYSFNSRALITIL